MPQIEILEEIRRHRSNRGALYKSYIYIHRDKFTFSHSRNPMGQPRRRRERHKG